MAQTPTVHVALILSLHLNHVWGPWDRVGGGFGKGFIWSYSGEVKRNGFINGNEKNTS